jgi:pectate lyase
MIKSLRKKSFFLGALCTAALIVSGCSGLFESESSSGKTADRAATTTTSSYVFNADDLTAASISADTACGTSNFFTLKKGSSTKINAGKSPASVTVDGSALSFTNVFDNGGKTGTDGTRTIMFTTTTAGTLYVCAFNSGTKIYVSTSKSLTTAASSNVGSATLTATNAAYSFNVAASTTYYIHSSSKMYVPYVKYSYTSDSDSGSSSSGSSSSGSSSGSSSSGTTTSSEITITKSAGWLESAYIQWTALSSASKYNVYYKKSSDSSYTQISGYLIRKYASYYRADVLGLAAGSYTLKVVGVNSSGTELSSSGTATVTVKAQDRTGFAFTGATMPGAYNSDGTLKSNAYVLYLTNSNKDSVSMAVVTSSKGTTTTTTGIDAILLAYKKGYDSRPLDIRMIGNVTDPATTENGDLVIENGNKTCPVTFEGVGNDAVANGWGIRLKNANYCEVCNIGFMNCDSSEGDNVGLQQGDNYVWVHNCDMFYGDAGSDADQIKGDGALDCKKSNYITFSYNHFWDNGKCNLLGLSEGTKSYASGAYYITYHHNWYDHSDSRHPRCRYYNAHVYNNYYDGNAKYGAGSCLGSSVFMDSNYFRSCKYPMMISMQGSDVYALGTTRDTKNNPTFSSEDGGMIKAYNNYMTGTYTFVPYGATSVVTEGSAVTASSRTITTTTDFDAYVVTSKSTAVPSSIKSYQGSNYYSNFDTASSMYSWTADSPDTAKTNVTTYAGRVGGGDFTWTFASSEDTNYSVITALKSALTAYSGSLVSIQGE